MLEFLLAIVSLVSHLFIFRFYKDLTDYFYFALMISASTILLHLAVDKIRRQKIKIDWKECFVFFVMLGLGLVFHDSKSLWLDEDSQAIFSSREFLCLSCSAGLEQQPPLSYVFTSFSLKYFGKSVFSLRFFSLFFFAGSCVYFWRILKFLNVNNVLAFAGLLLYYTNLEIFFFSTEARPYALFLMTSLWCLLNYLKLFEKQETVRPLELWVCLIFLIMSIGLQAQLLATSLFIVYLFLYGRKARRDIFVVHVAAAVLFLPIAFEIYQQSLVMNQFKSFGASLELRQLPQFLEHYSENLLLFSHPLILELTIGLGGYFIGCFFMKRKGRELFYVFLIFSTFFIFTYLGFINWKLLSKYYLISFVLMILAFITGVQLIFERMIPFWSRFVRAALLIVLILRGTFLLLNFEHESMISLDTREIPWKSFYAKLGKKINLSDRFYFYTFVSVGEWNLIGPVAVEYYLEEKYLPSFIEGNNILKLPNFRRGELVKGSVFIISPQPWTEDTLEPSLLKRVMNNLDVHYLEGVRVFELKQNHQSHSERLADFFTVITDHYGNYSWSASAWFARGEICRMNNDEECFDQSTKGLEDITLPPRLTNSGSILRREDFKREMLETLRRPREDGSF